MSRNISFGFLLLIVLNFNLLLGQEKKLTNEEEDARIDRYEEQLQDYLIDYLVGEYFTRASSLWNRDYSSADALERSVESNRQRWRKVIKPPVLKKSGPIVKVPYQVNGVDAEWIELPLGPIVAEAILAFPPNANKDKSTPLIIVQHGIGSGPETPFEDGKSYKAYAKALLDAGFAVLAPLNLRSIERRNNIERYARLANTSIPGIELTRLQHLLDVVLNDDRVDPERVGMWGVTLGGMATMFWMPLEPRIKAGVVSAWFNERRNKMVIPDENYRSFIVTNEDYVFLSGWLEEFSDDDLVSLIAPRAIHIQHGKADKIAHWPQVVEEYERAKLHYQKLRIADRIDLVLHEGGHEAMVEPGVDFFKRFLVGSLK